jgi:hypothetical protein
VLGRFSSTFCMSFEKRLRMRPTGVALKKVSGARNI